MKLIHAIVRDSYSVLLASCLVPQLAAQVWFGVDVPTCFAISFSYQNPAELAGGFQGPLTQKWATSETLSEFGSNFGSDVRSGQ